ncbi:hypothetical protein NKI86_22680 [Mesorhizobium sp. M0320]|uniref:hypothetical protein n=1 Tax=unclassified Mesorhizobium TaxID=325217 RepID=UPI00333A9ACC
MIDPETEAELRSIMRAYGGGIADNFFLVDPRDHVDAETYQIFRIKFEADAKQHIRSFIEHFQAEGCWPTQVIERAEAYAFEAFLQRYDVLLVGSGHGSA